MTARKYHELEGSAPERKPDGEASCIDGTMLVWHEGKRTICEVSGAAENQGAFWCRGRVTAQVSAAEYDKEIRDNE